MRVPVETNAAVEQLEVGECNPGVEDVLVDVVAGAGMDEQHVVLNVAVGQSSQPLDSLVADRVHRPAHHRGGIVVEPFEDLRIGAGAVVIADKGEPPAPGDLVDTVLGVAAISDDITKA